MSFLEYQKNDPPVSNKADFVSYITSGPKCLNDLETNFSSSEAKNTDFASPIFSISVDMVRLRSRVHFEWFQRWANDFLGCDALLQDFKRGEKFEDILKRNDYEVQKYWTSTKLNVCRHNWVIAENLVFGGSESYYLGFSPNSISRPEIKQWLYIEYNPNKIPIDGFLKKILETFFAKNTVELVSADVAWDIAEHINNLLIDKGKLHTYKYFSFGKDDVTHYFGVGYGRIKVYNKAKERKLDDWIKWTRVEISLEIKRRLDDLETYKSRETIPELFVYGETDDPVLRCLVMGVKSGFPINELTRAYRSKVKSALAGTLIDINNNQIDNTVKKYVKSYKVLLNFK